MDYGLEYGRIWYREKGNDILVFSRQLLLLVAEEWNGGFRNC